MGIKKEKPAPLYDLKHEYNASLENVLQQSTMLLTGVEMVLRNESSGLKPTVSEVLIERAAALREALYGES